MNIKIYRDFQTCISVPLIENFVFCLMVHIKRALNFFKGALLGMRQVLVKNDFYFTSNAFFVLEIFKILSSVFGHVEKRLD